MPAKKQRAKKTFLTRSVFSRLIRVVAMTMFVTLNIKSRQHGAQMCCADWRAVQSGDLDRLRAFMDGKLRISGDLTLFMLHEAHITRLSQET